MLEVLSDLVGELRAAGLPISVRETIDASRALASIDWSRRQDVRAALGATLVKRADHLAVFSTVFDLYFSRRHREEAPGVELVEGAPGSSRSSPGALEDYSPDAIRRLVEAALASGDEEALQRVARLSVSAFARIEPGRPVGVSYYLYRTLAALDLDAVLGQAGALGAGRVGLAGGEPLEDLAALERLGPLGARLVGEEYRARATRLRQLIEAEIRARLVDERGAKAVAASLRRPLVEDVDFMHATAAELAAMRRAIYPLTRALAARLARRRRHRRRGPLDIRRTIHASLSAGGVPVDLRFHRAHPGKPEIVVIADVSGSVASFARFTLHLVYAIAAQFSSVRTFVFVDAIDEVTAIFEAAATIDEAIGRVGAEAEVIAAEGHSNYGRVFAAFLESHGRELGPRTNVLVLGDARNNYHATGAGDLAEIGRRARRLYWLNPEPRAYWGSGDSVVEAYAAHTDGVFECRNLRQLEAFVSVLA